MNTPGPIGRLRDGGVRGLEHRETLHQWSQDRAALTLDLVEAEGRRGAVLFYTNPPVHQIGNPGLDAMTSALEALSEQEDVTFLLLTWPSDPVHAGGDLKESLQRLEMTTALRDRLEHRGATREEIDGLYGWADGRLDKGQRLYRLVRRISERVVTVGVCGGGMRFGGSAEVNLMADYLVGDSRSGMCFSEAMIGLIPGWAGVGRAITKAGVTNARWMAETAVQVKADQLRRAGIYDLVVSIDRPLPRKGRSGDKEADRRRYAAELADHDLDVWPRMVSKALELALEPPERAGEREDLATEQAIREEVARRADPETYREIWGRPLREVAEELQRLGRPLAPQSVAELEGLFEGVEADHWDEDAFVQAEKEADARLYRDRRLAEGIRATLEQRVADFRER